MNRDETLNHVRSKQNIVKVKWSGKNRVTYGGDQKRVVITYNDRGRIEQCKGRRVELLLTDGVVWSIALESATQYWTEVGGEWSAMVLKELASDCWS
jgi:hypothetical protein